MSAGRWKHELRLDDDKYNILRAFLASKHGRGLRRVRYEDLRDVPAAAAKEYLFEFRVSDGRNI